MVTLARGHFDSNVAEVRDTREAAFVSRRSLRVVGDNGNDGGVMARADLPQMEIGNPIAAGFEAAANVVGDVSIRHDVDQHHACTFHQAVGPACDHDASDHADNRVDPQPAVGPGQQERDDGKHGCGGVRKNLDVGGA